MGDLNTNEEDFLEVKREVNNIKKGLIAVMKKGLEKDKISTMEMEQLKQGCERELALALALMIEKLQTMEDKIVKIDEKVSLLSAEVKRNKEDIDSCSNYGHELAKNFANMDKKMMRERVPS